MTSPSRPEQPHTYHVWRFDGDDPWLVCRVPGCTERVDALTGKRFEAAAPEQDEAVRLHKYLHDEGVWPDEDEAWHRRVCEGFATPPPVPAALDLDPDSADGRAQRMGLPPYDSQDAYLFGTGKPCTCGSKDGIHREGCARLSHQSEDA